MKEVRIMNKKIIRATVNAVLFITISILLLTFTFSWFINNKNSDVDSIDSNVERVNIAEISKNGIDNWTNKLVIDGSIKNISEYSGSGKFLYSPYFGTAGKLLGLYRVDDKPNQNYYDIVNYIRIRGPIKILLDPSSSITPKDSSDPKNGIAGAVRMAVLTGEKPYGEPLIWAPNSKIQYSDGNVNFNGNVESQYKFAFSISQSTTLLDTDMMVVNTQGKDSGIVNLKLQEISNQVWSFGWGDLNTIENYDNRAKPIIETSGYNELIQKVTLRFWIEGTDRECVKDLIGGAFNVNIKFKVIDKKKAGGN